MVSRILIMSGALLLTALHVEAQSQPASDAKAPRVALRGHITQADGKPLPGAIAYVYTAGLRKGVGSL